MEATPPSLQASVVTDVIWLLFKIRDFPLKEDIKLSHQLMSAKRSPCIHILCQSCVRPEKLLIILWRNTLLPWTTAEAQLSLPTKDWSCILEARTSCLKFVNSRLNSHNFVFGSRSSIHVESISIPKKVILWLGPSTLDQLTKKPSNDNKFKRVFRAFKHISCLSSHKKKIIKIWNNSKTSMWHHASDRLR
jgi:hypothetical protein